MHLGKHADGIHSAGMPFKAVSGVVYTIVAEDFAAAHVSAIESCDSRIIATYFLISVFRYPYSLIA